MTTRWRNKVPAHATPDIPLRKPKTKAKHRDPVALPSGLALFKPSWAALWLNLMEVAKLAIMPVASGALGVLCFLIAMQHKGSGNEALFNGLGAVGIAMATALFIAVLPALGLIQLKSARGEITDFRDEFVTGLSLLWRYVAVNILVGVMTLVGLVLLIVPGLIVLHRFYLAPYYVLEQELGVIASLKASAADAKLFRNALWQLIAVTMGIKVISFASSPGVIIGSLLQFAYSFAAAVRYVEIAEAKRGEITYSQRKHLVRPAKRYAKK